MTAFVRIVYKNKNVAVIEKPAGMPSQKDPSGDLDAMSATSLALKNMGEKSDLWLVHRLDRTVGGLLAFARNKKSAAELSSLVASGKMEKNYLAVCHGIPGDGTYTDYLYKDSASGKAYIAKSERRGVKLAVLDSETIASSADMSLVRVNLKTGRFHQIRAQFSARGNSLVGDKKYGSRDAIVSKPALYCQSLGFELFGKKISVLHYPKNDEYPWSLFADDIKKLSEEK